MLSSGVDFNVPRTLFPDTIPTLIWQYHDNDAGCYTIHTPSGVVNESNWLNDRILNDSILMDCIKDPS